MAVPDGRESVGPGTVALGEVAVGELAGTAGDLSGRGGYFFIILFILFYY